MNTSTNWEKIHYISQNWKLYCERCERWLKELKKRKLTEDEIIQRNLDLQTAFNNYIFDHPEVLDKLPNSFRLVILPQDDPELSLLNLQMLSKRQKRDKPVVIVLMRSSGRISITAQPDVFLPLPLAA
ncbi:MAG: DUF5647 family protein [Chloroflexota bacterium]